MVESEETEMLPHRTNSRHSIVSGNLPSPLFRFTPLDLMFEELLTGKIKGMERKIPSLLEKPELVFGKIWATPTNDEDTPILQSPID